MQKKVFAVKDQESGNIFSMRYAQTDEELNTLLHKLKKINKIDLSYTPKTIEEGHEYQKLTQLYEKKVSEYLQFSKQTGLLLPLKYIVNDLINNKQSRAHYFLEKLYPMQDRLKVFVYLLKKNQGKYPELKNNLDELLDRENKDKYRIDTKGIGIVPTFVNTDDYQKHINRVNALSNKPIMFRGEPVITDDYTKMNIADEGIQDAVNSIAKWMVVLSVLYKDETIKKFVSTAKFQQIIDNVGTYVTAGHQMHDGRFAKSATDKDNIAFYLLNVIGIPDRQY